MNRKNFSETQTAPALWLRGYSEYWAAAQPPAASRTPASGHVWLSPHVAPHYGPHISGPNTALHVNWSASDNLADMSISEF